MKVLDSTRAFSYFTFTLIFLDIVSTFQLPVSPTSNNNEKAICPSPSRRLTKRQIYRKMQCPMRLYQKRTAELDPDQERRRQMLLSMLASAAAGTSFSPVQRASAATQSTESIKDPRIIRPPTDDRDYFSFTLDNGLRVLLCSDPSTNEAAAAMDVHVGASSDPKEVPGLAHFCEHMLFLGTKKYPNEDSFEAFLSSNGGSSNAYTESENTVYFFSLSAEADTKVGEALSRFGSFFTEPLFTPSATGRELNAIESENAKNLQNDAFRSFQITKSRVNNDHPFSKFYTGNKKTLLDDTKAAGIDLREELINFYKRYYSANQMTLAVVAPQSIESLKKMVIEAFADIPNRKVAKPEEGWAGIPPFVVDSKSIIPSFEHIVEVVPVSDLRQLTISWPIVYNSQQEKDEAILIKPMTYVAHMLGHEGPGSLLSYLKSKGWANAVGVSTSEELADFEVFDVTVGLTTQGLSAKNLIVEAIYSFINLMKEKTIPTYIYNELLKIEELQWRFAIKGGAATLAQSLAPAMQKYPPALYVAGPRRLALDDYETLSDAARSSFQSKDQLDRTIASVRNYIDRLTVENSMVAVFSKSFSNQTDMKEKWYGTDYRVHPISTSSLERWKNPISAKKLKVDFPAPNPFIPSETGLQVQYPAAPVEEVSKRTFESRMKPLRPPRVIRDDGDEGRWKVYFKEDDRFGLPKAFVIFQVQTKEVFSDARRAALSNFFELCAADKLGEYAYDAGLAGLIYDVKVLPRGVRLTFGGYNDKLAKFASYISKKLSKEFRDILPKSDTEFARYKDQIMRALSAFDVKQPYAHASYYAQLSLQPRRFEYSNAELRDETRKLTLPDLNTYVETLWANGKGEALIQGNVDENEALQMVKSIGDVLPFKPISSDEIPPRTKALPLPQSNADIVPTRLLINEPNPYQENAVSHVMLQSLGESVKDHVLIELLSSLVQEPFFNELRTQKQLGYIVSSGLRAVGESRTLSFVVQSSVAKADKVSIEIIKFLESVEEKILQKLSKADLAVYVKSLIDRKTEPDKDLSIEVTRNWSEIASGRLQFDRLQREAAALLNLEKDDLISFWRTLFAGNGRRVLITEVIPRQGAASSASPPTSTGYESGDQYIDGLVLGIDDLAQFRRDREKILEIAA